MERVGRQAIGKGQQALMASVVVRRRRGEVEEGRDPDFLQFRSLAFAERLKGARRLAAARGDEGDWVAWADGGIGGISWRDVAGLEGERPFLVPNVR